MLPAFWFTRLLMAVSTSQSLGMGGGQVAGEEKGRKF